MFKYLMNNCRSIRTFDESRPVDLEILRDLVDTARLSASAANRQPLKYRLICGEECANVQPLTAWAGALPHLELPPKGHMPTGFIMICHDTDISPVTDYAAMDVGIAAQSIVLGAAEIGLGCCMIGSFKPQIREVLGLRENLVPRLLIAVGYPAEVSVVCAPRDGDVTYFRDDAGLHFVPKRSLDEIIIDGSEK